ncbi:MAG: PD-(D/E)XK nuclease-like domain-containing protein [bacterium]
MVANKLTSRLPAAVYHALPGVSITRLKEIRRSPMHYRHLLDHPRESEAMTLGTAAHTAVLEPERFASQFAVWGERLESGALRPRRGKDWDAWLAANSDRIVLTDVQQAEAMGIAQAVRMSHAAWPYLADGGDPEVTMEWEMAGRECRGRVDWIPSSHPHLLVGLKTARDCRHFAFGAAAAKLGYHLQWAWYHDGYRIITGIAPKMVEIVVETAPPYAVAVYNIPEDIIQQGRDEYRHCLEDLDACEHTGNFPGPQEYEEDLTLPSWAYPQQADDISDLDLE